MAKGTAVFRAVRSSGESSKAQVFSKEKVPHGDKGKNFPEALRLVSL